MSIAPLAAWLGGTELIIILAILLLLFGGSKLPSLAKGLGQSVREFKKASQDEDTVKAEEAKKAATTPPAPPAAHN
jgi:sec-independent protein translocase protein TatA